MSRIYIWKDNYLLASLGANSQIDNYMLGYKGGTNTCSGVIPCSFCSLELVNNVIQCTS